jgi:hypothetical protein
MAYEALHKGGKGSEAERCSWAPGAAGGIARGHAAPFSYVEVVGAPGISVSAGCLSARSTGRSRRNHGADHVEAPAANCGTAAWACQKQRINDGRHRHRGAQNVPANKEDAWLSGAAKAARSKSTLLMLLIACSSRNSPKPTPFWFPLESAPWDV